ncbi:transposase [Streptomyces sp. NPDC060223]|uniref:transposase n=1 Tax=unclassified Streptomyces TaxID=2593676 RepID=UPI00363489D4
MLDDLGKRAQPDTWRDRAALAFDGISDELRQSALNGPVRAKWLSHSGLTRLQGDHAGRVQSFEAELRDFNVKDDHVHLLVRCPPKVQLSKLVNSCKDVVKQYIEQ